MSKEPIFIVTTTAKEFKDYGDRKKRKQARAAFYSLLIFVCSFGYIFYLFWQAVHS